MIRSATGVYARWSGIYRDDTEYTEGSCRCAGLCRISWLMGGVLGLWRRARKYYTAAHHSSRARLVPVYGGVIGCYPMILTDRTKLLRLVEERAGSDGWAAISVGLMVSLGIRKYHGHAGILRAKAVERGQLEVERCPTGDGDYNTNRYRLTDAGREYLDRHKDDV